MRPARASTARLWPAEGQLRTRDEAESRWREMPAAALKTEYFVTAESVDWPVRVQSRDVTFAPRTRNLVTSHLVNT